MVHWDLSRQSLASIPQHLVRALPHGAPAWRGRRVTPRVAKYIGIRSHADSEDGGSLPIRRRDGEVGDCPYLTNRYDSDPFHIRRCGMPPGSSGMTL